MNHGKTMKPVMAEEWYFCAFIHSFRVLVWVAEKSKVLTSYTNKGQVSLHLESDFSFDDHIKMTSSRFLQFLTSLKCSVHPKLYGLRKNTFLNFIKIKSIHVLEIILFKCNKETRNFSSILKDDCQKIELLLLTVAMSCLEAKSQLYFGTRLNLKWICTNLFTR